MIADRMNRTYKGFDFEVREDTLNEGKYVIFMSKFDKPPFIKMSSKESPFATREQAQEECDALNKWSHGDG